MVEFQNFNSVPNSNEEEIQDSDIHKRLQILIQRDSRNLDTWTSLVADVEKEYADDRDIICSSYNSFLSRFPLCHWFWSKYAYHILRISLDPHKAMEIFERALNSAMYSLGLWIDYCRFGMSFYEDKCAVARLFKIGTLFVGKDYLSHALWDLYIKHEHSQRNWNSVAYIYLQVLRYPTEKLHKYYNNFIKFVAGMEEEMKQRKRDSVEPEGGVQPFGTMKLTQKEIYEVIEDIQNPSDEALHAEAVRKYKFLGDQFYEKARKLDDRIKGYENNIRKRYFDMVPLDDEELKNWHMYLDFVEKQGDFLWALQLYERCLIPCANYPEFWMRYVEFMDSKGGRELANFALERATGIFLRGVPEMHFFNATYKERIGDASGARAAFIQFDDGSASFLTRHVIELANMERRLGNVEGAYDIYEKAISLAEEKKQWRSFSTLFIHLSRLKYTITRSADAVRDVLMDGIHRAPHCRWLLEELIKFAMMHQEAIEGNLLESIIANAIYARSDASQGLDSKDREDISSLYLEFVDLCGAVDDIRKARNRHIQLFPHLVRDNTTCKRQESSNISKQGQDTACGLQDVQFEGEQRKMKNMVQGQLPEMPVHCDKKPDLACDRSMDTCDETNEQERKQQEDFLVLKQTRYNETPAEVHGIASDSLKQRGIDRSGPENPSCTSAERAGEDESELMNMTSAVVDLSSQNTSEPYVSRGYGLSESSQGISSSIRMPEIENQKHRSPVSFEHLSFNSKEIMSQESIPMTSLKQDVTLDMSESNTNLQQSCVAVDSIPPGDSPRKSQDCAKVEHSHDCESVSSFHGVKHQEHTPAEKQTNFVSTPSRVGEYLEKNQTIPSHQGKNSESPHHLENQQHGHQHVSPHQHSQACPCHPLQASVSHKNVNIIYPPETNPIQKKLQEVNNQSPSQINQPQVSSPHVSYSEDVSQFTSHPADNHNQTWAQMWQYHYQQQQQEFGQRQYQLQLLQSMQQQQQQQYLWQSQLQPQQRSQERMSSVQQNRNTQQQLQQSWPYLLNPLQQQQYLQQAQQQLQQHYQLETQQVQQQDHQHENVVDPMHQKGHEQHAAQSYEVHWQQYQLQQQAYMLQQLQQQQQQQYVQYGYSQLTEQPPPDEHHPLPQREENDDEKQ